jgi:hypothetical protein
MEYFRTDIICVVFLNRFYYLYYRLWDVRCTCKLTSLNTVEEQDGWTRWFLFDTSCVGNHLDAYPLAVLFFERVGPIGTCIFIFLLFFFSFSIFSFSPIYKKIQNSFKFWTDFKWNKFSNSEQISNGTIFQILNIFQMK